MRFLSPGHTDLNPRLFRLALKDRRSRDLVRLSATVWLSLGVVDVNQNSRILRRVRAREADGLAASASPRAGYLDLSASLDYYQRVVSL